MCVFTHKMQAKAKVLDEEITVFYFSVNFK